MSGEKKVEKRAAVSDAHILVQFLYEVFNLEKLFVKFAYKFCLLQLLKIYFSILVIFEKPPKIVSLSGIWIITRIPSKIQFADGILLLFCKPDDAETAAGDLFEELEKVQSRHGKWYCNFWFFWELSLLVISKGRARFIKSVFGPLVDLWKRKSS